MFYVLVGLNLQCCCSCQQVRLSTLPHIKWCSWFEHASTRNVCAEVTNVPMRDRMFGRLHVHHCFVAGVLLFFEYLSLGMTQLILHFVLFLANCIWQYQPFWWAAAEPVGCGVVGGGGTGSGGKPRLLNK
jgi:hypothetical protein